MRDAFFFEWEKIKRRRLVTGLLLGMSFLIPIGLKFILHLEFKSGNASEGLFMDYSAFSAISFATSYFFIPVWILILIGMEFSNGHVARIIFFRSKNFYFFSKIFYCLTISGYFTLLVVISLLLFQFTAPFNLESSIGFYLGFAFQSFYTFLSTSLLLLVIAFIFKSPIISFVSYILLDTFEALMYTALKGFFSMDWYLLPIHSTRIFYVRSGVSKTANYYNPLLEFSPVLLFQPLIIFTLVCLAYLLFIKRDIEQLSD